MSAKYSHKMWEQFAHTFAKPDFCRKCTLWYRICMLTFCVETLAFFHVWNKVLQAKWLYWPWDHSMVFMKKSLWHGICQSDLCFSCETYFLDSLYNWYISLCAIYIYMYACVLYVYIYTVYIWCMQRNTFIIQTIEKVGSTWKTRIWLVNTMPK